MDRWRAISYAHAAVLVALVSGCFSESSESGDAAPRVREAAPCLSLEEAERMAQQVVELVNLERAAANMSLQPVTLDKRLTDIAGSYACRMIEDGFFDHVDPSTGRGPGERALAGKYRYYAVGENLAAGPQTAADVMELWMESPNHRAIILDPQWTEIGIGLRSGGDFGTYWVQVFGLPASDL